MRQHQTARKLTGGVRSGIWILPLALGLPAVVAYYWLPVDVANFAYLAFGAAAVVAVPVGVWLHRPARVAPWILVAAGIALWTGGDLIYAALAPEGGNVPVPSLADASYLAGYVALILGLGWLARRSGSDVDRGVLLDAAILASSAGIFVWLALVEPLLTDPATQLEAAITSAAYPALDTLLIGVLAHHVLSHGRTARAVVLLAAGLGAYLAADLVSVAESVFGTYSALGLVNAGWLAGYVLLAAAFLHPSMHTLSTASEQTPDITRTRRLLLGVAATVPAVLILVHDSWDVSDRAVLGIGSMWLTALVVVRLVRALRDQVRLRSDSHFEARHDALTGLANRKLFTERLRTSLGDPKTPVGLIYVDLDDFKSINDTLGHHLGDAVLETAADRLRGALRRGDDVARLGGDEFAVIVAGADRAVLSAVAERIVHAINQPAEINGVTIGLRASVGGVIATAISDDELLRRADVAMYAAKKAHVAYVEYEDSLELDQRGGLGRERAGTDRDVALQPALAITPGVR